MIQTIPFWTVQDVFSSGLSGPGFTTHDTRGEAEQEAKERGGKCVVLPGKTCRICSGIIGRDGPLQGGCNECR